MSIQILVADESEARFYEIRQQSDLRRGALELAATVRLEDADAHRPERQLRSDRPGRAFSRAPLSGTRRGATARHAVGAERHPREQLAKRFARRIAGVLRRLQGRGGQDQWVLVAPPHFLGLLRAALPEPLPAQAVTAIHKDLVRLPPTALRTYLARALPPGAGLEALRPRRVASQRRRRA
jgi:protein required for attachment to host cells